MAVLDEIHETWQLLDQLAPEDLRIRQIGTAAEIPTGRTVALGVDALARRHLLVQCDPDHQVKEDRRSTGVQILSHELTDRGSTRRFVDVICQKAHLSELFDVLVAEMIAELGADPRAPDAACRRVLDRWRELLDDESDAVSGPAKIAGAFAELWHLRELARLDVDCLGAWAGPHGARHDFLGPGAALEVKSTLTHHGRFFEITSHDQLEPLLGLPLYLGVMKLERLAVGGMALSDLVDEIASNGVDRGRLLGMLAMSGLRRNDIARSPISFRVVEQRIYEVTSGFPRVTPGSFVGGSLPAGVLRLRYLIDLTNEPPVPVPDSGHLAIYRALLPAK